MRLTTSSIVPLLSMSWAMISGLALTDSDPPHSPDTRMSLVTFPGKLRASSCAMDAPMDSPRTCAEEIPRASIRVAVSRASRGMENGLSDELEYPVPRLSKMMTRKCSEIFERTGGFHVSIVDASPLMRTTGYPEPDSLYARETSSTGTMFTGIRVTTRYLLSDPIISLCDGNLSGET